MKYKTESEIRGLYQKSPFETYSLSPSEKLTPAALQFLQDRKIKLIRSDQQGKENSRETTSFANTKFSKGYVLVDSGDTVLEKPEDYTHLRGNRLVPKHHKRIKFRGMVDTLEAQLIMAIVGFKETGCIGLSEDLNLILEYIRKMMRAEVLDEPLEPMNFKGWDDSEIRERSHHPENYFGTGHFSPDPGHGRVMAELNLLRTQIRQAEIAAVDTFYDETKRTSERQDIIQSLNRLSSLIYILMCKHLTDIKQN